MFNLDSLVSRPEVQDALQHAIYAGNIGPIRTYWNHSMSREQKAEYSHLYITFEAAVRRRYYFLTGETF